MKVYLILNDEPLDYRNIFLVETKEQAEKICKYMDDCDYEELHVMSNDDVADHLLDHLWGKYGEEKGKEMIREIFPEYEVEE